jgi:arylsulfatase A-like enzyme
LEALFIALEAEGRLTRTLVVLYGDHDWGLPLDDTIHQLAAFTHAPELLLDRVPVLIRLPDGSKSGTVGTVGGHIDVAPTVLHLLGLERPASMLGTSLLPARSRVAVFPNGSAVGPNRAWVAGDEIWQPEGRARGQSIENTGCWDRISGSRLDDGACDALATRASEELKAARDIVWFDQAAQLAGQE